MAKDSDNSKKGGNRFKFPPSPQGSSKIHEDLASSRHQVGQRPEENGVSMLRRVLPIGRKLQVGVVGGGVAGMRCAEVLLQHDVEVTIIEARDRLGGRLGQATLKGGHIVDLGPNWIHGTGSNPIFDLAKETGTVLHEWGENQTYIDSDRSVVSLEATRDAAEFAWETIAEAFKESNAHSKLDAKHGISSSKSLADFYDEKIAQIRSGDRSEAGEARIKLLQKVSKFFGPFTGQPVEKQSLKFFWLEECLEGDNLFCADSYAKVLRRLTEPIERQATVLFERSVQTIRAKNDKLGGSFSPYIIHSRSNGQAGPNTIDEQEAEFDEVVVTTPLGWLKEHPEAFDPPLPPRLSEAIKALGYGTLDKVYITFSEAWWNEPLQRGGSVPLSEAQQTLPNVTATTAPAHQGGVAGSMSDQLVFEDTNYSGFATFLQPEYAQKTNSSMQNQEICNLAALPGHTAQPTLLFYIYDDFGHTIADVVASLPPRALNEPASKEYMTALWPYFEPYVSQLPRYDAGASQCQPVDMLATAWVNDEYAGHGSYTNFPVGLERGDEDVMELRRGVPDGGIWFAGEHTAPFVALGTVTGAYWSGEAVARRILDAYGHDGHDSTEAASSTLDTKQ